MIEIFLMFVLALVVYNSRTWQEGKWENKGHGIWFKQK